MGPREPPPREATPVLVDRVILDAALPVLRQLPEACVDLVYIDPPFATGQVRRLQSIRTGRGTRVRRDFAGRTYQWEVVTDLSFRDDMPLPAYLAFLRQHLAEAHRVLKETGSIYLHLDFHAVHHARLIMDEIFGADRFLNEIIWAYDYGGRPRDRWPRKHDNSLWYARGARWAFQREAIDRIPYMAPGLVGPDKAARGKVPTDVWWMTIVPTNGRERTGYPTQKPERLLQRIITASSRPGDLVLDFFAGSGTTGVAARRLQRHYLLVDINPEAVAIARDRLARLATPQPRLDGQG